MLAAHPDTVKSVPEEGNRTSYVSDVRVLMETQDSSDAQTIAVAPEAENVNVVTSPVSQMEPFHQKTAFSGFRASAPGRFWRSLSSRWSDIKATTFGPIGVCTLPTKLHLVLTSDIVTSPFQKYERYYSYTGLGLSLIHISEPTRPY